MDNFNQELTIQQTQLLEILNTLQEQVVTASTMTFYYQELALPTLQNQVYSTGQSVSQLLKVLVPNTPLYDAALDTYDVFDRRKTDTEEKVRRVLAKLGERFETMKEIVVRGGN